MYVVCVDLSLRPGQRPAFMPLMIENARLSRQSEPGCHRFDICYDPRDPEQIFLYEIYASRAAFDAHLASTHFQTFDARVAGMVASKSVRVLELLAPPP